MSHATVLVKIPKPAIVSTSTVEAALDVVMAPYNEQPEPGSPYLKFVEEDLSEYETGTREMIQTSDGERLDPWNERFRKPSTLGMGTHTHVVPKDCIEIEVPFKDIYPTLADFAQRYHGCEEHEGRFGFWQNPNAKWDWYQIGGRWRGHFPLTAKAPLRVGKAGTFDNEAEPNKGDIVTFDEIDFVKVETETREKATKFWKEWQAWLKDPKDTGWDGPRSMAMDMGLLEVVQGPAEGIPWAKIYPNTDESRRTWTDVPKIISEAEFFKTYSCCFNPLVTFAALDTDGWHEAGKLGWFGCSSATPETFVEFRRTFTEKFIKDDGALYVCVDYHI